MGEKYSIKRLDAIEGRYNRYLFIKENYPKLLSKCKINLFYLCIYYLQQAMAQSGKNEYIPTYTYVKDCINNLNFNKEDYKFLKLDQKIWIIISKLSLKTCCKIRNIFNIGV